MSWLADFHFLRPWALLLLIPVVIFVVALWYTRANHSRWQQLIAPELLVHLIDGASKRRSRMGLVAISVAMSIACLALAGPAWERQSSPVHRQANALIIALDLSPSMVAEDVKPSRLVRARLKVAELLKVRDEGETALIVYGDDAHLVTPLTDDTRTITSLLPTLTPAIMPVPGSRPEAAVERALQMFNDAGYASGNILLVTDEVTELAADNINQTLHNSGIQLLILGVGTDAGAPIPSGRGGFVRDANNDVVIARLGSARLQKLAQQNDGRYITNTLDQQDIEYLNPDNTRFDGIKERDNVNQTMDQWLDRGPLLVLLLLPVLLLCFRRGLIVAVLLLPILSLHSNELQASALDKAFLTPDQRGAKALEAGDAESAASEFDNPLWKGTAQYKAGNFEAAANSFAQSDSALAHYNRGNALARAGNLDDAIKAYDSALGVDPTLQDAKDNKALVEALKEQQQEQQNQQEQNQSGENSSEGDQSQQDQQENPENQENSEGDSNQSEQTSSASSSAGNESQNPQNQNGQSEQQNSAVASSDSGSPEQDDQAQGQSSSSAAAQEQTEEGQASSSSSGKGENDQESEMQALEAQPEPLTPEEQEARQATEQWLRQIPDDPSGLLRNKFRYEYNQQRQERQEKKLNTFGNSEQRW
ncbi:VWA domain-containing protein [Gilvimarinus agarilyticus]|uniref:VWA domain-containing protein n=1 Tax=Gilvimarinus agarilyticus TaxID=679259 RepID=UPI000698E946|nr:VWA domain-containing protein [Gilvimarinus agarilyticus]